jgi:hypothetical protein
MNLIGIISLVVGIVAIILSTLFYLHNNQQYNENSKMIRIAAVTIALLIILK